MVNLDQQNRYAVVGMVMMVLLTLLLPSLVTCYRLESMEDLTDLFDRNDQSLENRERVWKRDLPLLVNLLKSLDDWERHRSIEKESEPEENSIHQTKRARETIYGAMPPLGELCRMMGYAACPH